MSDILVVGSANMDLIVKTSKIPEIGETVIGGDFHMVPGGKGANQALAVKRLGGKVDFLCCLGDDVYGEKLYDALKSEGFDQEYLKEIKNCHSGIALITVDSQGRNSIAVSPGSNWKLSPKVIEENNPFKVMTNYLLVQLEIPMETVKLAMEKAHEKRVKIILNAAPAVPLTYDLLSLVDILVVNEIEAEILSGLRFSDHSFLEISDSLLAKGVRTVIITLGSKGSFIRGDFGYKHIPAYKVEVIDTTAAGDTYCGALTYYLNKGYDIEESVKFASAAAAVCVTKLGAQKSIPKSSEVNTFLYELGVNKVKL